MTQLGKRTACLAEFEGFDSPIGRQTHGASSGSRRCACTAVGRVRFPYAPPLSCRVDGRAIGIHNSEWGAALVDGSTPYLGSKFGDTVIAHYGGHCVNGEHVGL